MKRPMTASEERLILAAIAWGDDEKFDPLRTDFTPAIEATDKLCTAVRAVVRERKEVNHGF